MRIAILGNGGFGTAMSIACERAGNDVHLWGYEEDYTAEMVRTRENPRFLPSVRIPEAVELSSDPARVLDGAEAVLVAVPTQHVRSVVQRVVEHLPSKAPVVSLSKGLEQSTALRPSEVIHAVLGADRSVLAISGPSHAEEVGRGLPAAVVVAGGEPEHRHALQRALSDSRLRLYRNDDILGVELCGALKNVMALAAGIAEGLGLGDNTRAAILSRGLVEMRRYGTTLGAKDETFFGLAGVGDLAVTAFSPHGRNRSFGERIGRGETVDQILASTQKVSEGVWTSRVVRDRARELGIEMPLSEAVCAVLFEGLPADRAVAALMERDYKREM